MTELGPRRPGIHSLRCLLILLVAAIWPTAANAVPVPSAQFPTVQSAINAVRTGALPDGTVIEVQPGTYNEALAITDTARSMTIRGVGGAGVTVINAGGSGRSAVTVRNAPGSISLEELTFTGGQGGPGPDQGGGFTANNASPVFVNCVISGNTSLVHGGGGLLLASNAIFQTTVIENNTAAHSGGGVLAALASNPTFVSSTIRNNTSGLTVTNGAGGGVAIIDSSATFRSSVVTGNQAKAAGGGIFNFTVFTAPGPTTLTIEDSDISNNTATRASGSDPPAFGGGLHVEDNVIARVTQSRVRANTAHNGGGISNHRARLEVTSSYIESNQALDPGGGVGGVGGGVVAFSNNDALPLRPAAVTVVVDSVVRSNTARIGGGLSSDGDQTCGGSPCNPSVANATLSVTDSLIDGNTALNWGAGFYTNHTNLTVSDSQVFRNHVTAGGADSTGGGFLLILSAATITDTTIAENSALARGGGLHVIGTSVSVVRANIYGNAASGQPGSRGGGLFVSATPQSNGTVQDSILADNTNFQISEDACPTLPPFDPAPLLMYRNNRIGNADAYRSPCNPPGDLTAEQLNEVPGGRASGNTTASPVFASFKATPGVAASVLAWSVGRATTIDIASLGNNRPAPTSSQDVGPSACARTFVLTANTFPGSVAATVLGTGGLVEFGPSTFAYNVAFTGGVFVAAGDINGDGRAEVVTSPGAGGGPHVRIFQIDNAGNFTPFAELFAYAPVFTGGVFVAAGNVDGAPGAEIVSGPGAGGGPHVRVFKVTPGGAVSPFAEFFAYDSGFTGGVRVAADNVDVAGTAAELITAPGAGGGPHVRVFKVTPGGAVSPFAEFFAYTPGFTGGVFVTTGDIDGDGVAEIITAPGAGGGPHVRVWKVSPGGAVTLFTEFFAYDPGFLGGVFVAGGDVASTGGGEIVTGAGAGGGPDLRVHSVFSGLVAQSIVYPPGFTGGVRVAAGNVDGAGQAEIITGAGPSGGPHVRIFRLPVCP